MSDKDEDRCVNCKKTWWYACATCEIDDLIKELEQEVGFDYDMDENQANC